MGTHALLGRPYLSGLLAVLAVLETLELLYTDPPSLMNDPAEDMVAPGRMVRLGLNCIER